MKPRSAKNKGARLQKWVCEQLARVYDVIYDQSSDMCPIKSRTMGLSGTDIIIQDKELREKFPYDIECKNTEKFSLYSTIEQAESNTEVSREWLIVTKKNQHKPVVVMSWESFERLLKKTIYN